MIVLDSSFTPKFDVTTLVPSTPDIDCHRHHHHHHSMLKPTGIRPAHYHYHHGVVSDPYNSYSFLIYLHVLLLTDHLSKGHGVVRLNSEGDHLEFYVY